MRKETWIGVLVFALSFGAMTGFGYAQDDIRTLDKKFRKIAKTCIPRTVLVKSYVGQMGGRAGYGTGAIISKDGYILTCSHVIDIANSVEVVLADKTVYKAKVLGKNKKQDYALLKIEPKADLPFFPIGDSGKVALGQWVMALGHPGGPYADKQPAFSVGRITGLHRKLPVQFMQRYYNDAIQTDCPIYAGNSGGPLIDLEGNLLGLNGAILMVNDNAYAVPVKQVMAKIADLKAGKDIVGESAGPEAFAEMQKHMNPKDMEDMQKKLFENFGKMFGGEGKDNPMNKMLEQFGKMFGGDKDGKPGKPGENPFGDLFGGELDLEKLFKQFGDMFGGGGKDGEGMDMNKLFKEFGKMFGGENPFGGKPGNPGKPNPALPKPVEPKKPEARPAAKRGYLGIVPASDSDRQELGGVLVGQVIKKSPADLGDMRKGDIVVSINGKETGDVWSLRQVLSSHGVGDTIKITVIRSRLLDTTWVRGKVEVEVTLGARK